MSDLQTTPKAVAYWPFLTIPQTKFDPDGVYKVDLIFDPFMGSGTVGKQAELLKRRWLGCEIAKEYCEIIKKRITPVANQISF